MPGIGVITNPRSRLNKRDPSRMRKLGYLIGDRGSAAATKSLDDLYRVAEEFMKAEIDILGINGGDGTIHHTLTAFLKTYGDRPMPQVAILRGGTMNTIANSYNIRGEPSKLLFELVDRYHNNEAFEVFDKEILQIGDAYGFIFGNGIVFNFLEAYYNTGKPSPAVAARLLGRAIVSAMFGGSLAKQLTRRFRAKVTVDGDVWARDDFMTVAIACVEQVGLGFRPWYRANEPGVFPILGVHVQSPFGIVTELGRIYRGQPMSRHKVIDQVAREVLFEAEEIQYIVDGDTYKAKDSLRIRVGPKLRFIRLTGHAVSDRLESSPAGPPGLGSGSNSGANGKLLDDPDPKKQLPA